MSRHLAYARTAHNNPVDTPMPEVRYRPPHFTPNARHDNSGHDRRERRQVKPRDGIDIAVQKWLTGDSAGQNIYVPSGEDSHGKFVKAYFKGQPITLDYGAVVKGTNHQPMQRTEQGLRQYGDVLPMLDLDELSDSPTSAGETPDVGGKPVGKDYKALAQFNSKFGRVVAAGTLVAILSGCASVSLPRDDASQLASEIGTKESYNSTNFGTRIEPEIIVEPPINSKAAEPAKQAQGVQINPLAVKNPDDYIASYATPPISPPNPENNPVETNSYGAVKIKGIDTYNGIERENDGTVRLTAPLNGEKSLDALVEQMDPSVKTSNIKELLDSLLSDRSIDQAFREGEYLEGVVRVPYDFGRKTVIRAVTAPKTFLYDVPSAVIDDAKDRINKSTTKEDKRGHFWGSLIFAIPLYAGKIIEDFGRYVLENPIEAFIHGVAYGVIGAEMNKGGKKHHSPPPSSSPAPAPPGPPGGAELEKSEKIRLAELSAP